MRDTLLRAMSGDLSIDADVQESVPVFHGLAEDGSVWVAELAPQPGLADATMIPDLTGLDSMPRPKTAVDVGPSEFSRHMLRNIHVSRQLLFATCLPSGMVTP